MPADFAPGETWSCSNSNYVLLALIVQKVTGKTWDRFLGDRIFAPLGMMATRRDSRAEVIKRRASLYEWRDDALVAKLSPVAAFPGPYSAWSALSAPAPYRTDSAQLVADTGPKHE